MMKITNQMRDEDMRMIDATEILMNIHSRGFLLDYNEELMPIIDDLIRLRQQYCADWESEGYEIGAM